MRGKGSQGQGNQQQLDIQQQQQQPEQHAQKCSAQDSAGSLQQKELPVAQHHRVFSSGDPAPGDARPDPDAFSHLKFIHSPLLSGPPIAPNEAARVATFDALGLWDAPYCPELDFVLTTVARVFGAPYSAVALFWEGKCFLSNTVRERLR